MSLTPSHFMAIAEVVSTAGTCERRQVGCVLVRDRRIISTGYNGSPSGMPHCVHDEYSDIIQEPSDGYRQEGCQVSVHAELNAIAFAARHGISTEGAVLYTTDEPCLKCAQAIINAGIKAVLYDREYRVHDGKELLEKAEVPVGHVDGSGVFAVQDQRGDGSSVYPGEPAQKAGQSRSFWPEGVPTVAYSRRSSGGE